MPPELGALMEALEKQTLANSDEDDLTITATNRAKELCVVVNSGKRINFVQGDGKVFKHVFSHVFSNNASIRRGARYVTIIKILHFLPSLTRAAFE